MKKTIYFNLVVIGLSFICSCAPPRVKKDVYFEKWKEFAEKHRGSSPKADISITDINRGLDITPKKKKKKSLVLPKSLVTLKMRDASVKAIIHALAKAGNVNIITTKNINGKLDVDINKVPWDKVFNAILRSQGLTYTYDGKIIRVMSREDLNAEIAIDQLEAKKEEYEKRKKELAPLKTKVVKINFADAANMQKVLMNVLTKDREGKQKGSIVVDSHTNSLVVSALPDDMKKILDLIKVLDKPTDQIYIKAYIIEANRNVARELGIQWGARWINSINGGKNQVKLSGVGTGTSSTTGETGGDLGFISKFPAAISSSGGGLNILIGDISQNLLDMELSALEQKGQIRILSTPSLTTLDNQMAFTESGQKVPYITVDENGNRDVNFEDAVLRLEVTPHVIADKYLKMDIKVKKDEVDFSKTVDGNPAINKKETQTTLVVADGETIVISGLSKQSIRDSVAGIPILKNIPALGYLFKGDSKSEELEDILIFITPIILRSKERLNTYIREHEITADELDKLLSSTGDKRAKKWIEKAKEFVKQKKWEEVLRFSSLALSLDPGLKEAYFYGSLGYYHKQNYKDALSYINKALIIDSNYVEALNLKGKILENMGYLKKALKFYAKGCSLYFQDACKNHKRLFYYLNNLN